ATNVRGCTQDCGPRRGLSAAIIRDVAACRIHNTAHAGVSRGGNGRRPVRSAVAGRLATGRVLDKSGGSGGDVLLLASHNPAPRRSAGTSPAVLARLSGGRFAAGVEALGL